ncbi:hypothetical protein T07_11490 [Trichinella nelsoni]|uniref:Uncharacterized protein n=1 Tax=Trichinella nelsoni TaxID=6336 RepID=A0A0V0RD95_9BILA|nr:hypothetical protein T07_11490 [Trichinella nelsoni]
MPLMAGSELTAEIYPFVSDMMMFKSCYTIDEHNCIMSVFFPNMIGLTSGSKFWSELTAEIYPFVYNMMMFK